MLGQLWEFGLGRNTGIGQEEGGGGGGGVGGGGGGGKDTFKIVSDKLTTGCGVSGHHVVAS